MELNKKQRSAIKALNTLKSLELLELEDLRELRKKPKLSTNSNPNENEEFDVEIHLLRDLMWSDGRDLKNFSTISIGDFEAILALVRPAIATEDTALRYTVSPRVRLAVTLRYIVAGDSYRTLELLSKVPRKTISEFIPEVLSALYEALKNEHLVTPNKSEDWIRTAYDFQYLWDFPQTLGAMDGKHIKLIAPETSSADQLDHKEPNSIILFAVVNAHSKFISIDVTPAESDSDCKMFASSTFFEALRCGKLNVPEDDKLPGSRVNIPFYFIGSDKFGLDKNIMKAYNRNMKLSSRQLMFNYRLSRARMPVEMAFKRLCSRFRVFQNPIEESAVVSELIVKTCCVLHNFLSKDVVAPYSPSNEEEFQLPNTLTPLGLQEHPNCYKYAYRIREEVCRHLAREVPH